MAKKEIMDAAAGKVAAPATIEEALEVIAKLEQTIADQEGIIEELNANNSELEKKIEEYKTGVVIMPEVTIGSKKYQVNNGTLHNGVRYSREELAKNESVCESILAINGQLTITPLNVEEAN